jgi:hypothetical protein
MLSASIKIVLAILLGLSIVTTFGSLTATVVGLIQAAKRRKPAVHFLSAIASRNVMFKPELYEDDAQRWSRLHRLGFIGVFVSVVVAGVAALCLSAFD